MLRFLVISIRPLVTPFGQFGKCYKLRQVETHLSVQCIFVDFTNIQRAKWASKRIFFHRIWGDKRRT